MKLLGQYYWADDPCKPDWNLDQHQYKDKGTFSVVILDMLGLDSQGGHEDNQEQDVEQGENMISRAKVTSILEIIIQFKNEQHEHWL